MIPGGIGFRPVYDGRLLRNVLGTVRRKIHPPRLVRPSVVIIGAQKAGTTPLVRYLSQHPRMLQASEKEMDYFGSATRGRLGEEFYHRHFRFYGAHENSVAFEASPHYLLADNAAQDLHDYAPDCRVVCLLRDPVSRAFSAFKMYQRFLREDSAFFRKWNARYHTEQDLDALLPRPPAHATDMAVAITAEIAAIERGERYEWHLLEYGLYARNLAPFFTHFSADQLHLIASEALAARTEETLQKLCAFLGVDAFDWARADLRKSHQETRGEKIPQAARQLLEDFYRQPDQQLEQLTGRQFYQTTSP